MRDRDLPDLEPILPMIEASRRSVSQEDLKSLELDTPLTQINLKVKNNLKDHKLRDLLVMSLNKKDYLFYSLQKNSAMIGQLTMD